MRQHRSTNTSSEMSLSNAWENVATLEIQNTIEMIQNGTQCFPIAQQLSENPHGPRWSAMTVATWHVGYRDGWHTGHYTDGSIGLQSGVHFGGKFDDVGDVDCIVFLVFLGCRRSQPFNEGSHLGWMWWRYSLQVPLQSQGALSAQAQELGRHLVEPYCFAVWHGLQFRQVGVAPSRRVTGSLDVAVKILTTAGRCRWC